jgi:predicted nuclease of predicted toxin-antitoxin system
MRLLADLHISPSTVAFLRTLGHDVVRVDAILPNTASDEEIVVAARAAGRSILTQDLDFSAIIALSGAHSPSLVSLRLGSSRVTHVNEVLARVLPQIEDDLARGSVVSVEDGAIRRRTLPIE